MSSFRTAPGWFALANMSERGEIRNIERKQQINSFKNIRYGNITPTDIDGLIEYQDKAYVIFEIKYGNAELPKGQRKAIQRLVTDAGKANKKALAIIAEHHVDDTRQPVDVSQCDVREVFLSSEKERKWRKPNHSMKLKECIDLFITKIVDSAL